MNFLPPDIRKLVAETRHLTAAIPRVEVADANARRSATLKKRWATGDRAELDRHLAALADARRKSLAKKRMGGA